jgi:hypothetical protein
VFQEDILFDVISPVGFRIRTTRQYWHLIVSTKHPDMEGRLDLVKQSLEDPEIVVLSIADTTVYLFYRAFGPKRWVCSVAKRLNGTGFLVTAYVTDSIKKGQEVWHK